MANEQIRSAIEAATKYLTEHRDEARYTDSAATATLIEGLRVQVDGPASERVTTDMPKSIGGVGEMPSPGWLFRAAVASCGTSLIAMRAAAEGVDLRSLEVTVDSESDDYGMISESVPAGPLAMAVRVRIEASGDGSDRLREIAEWGLDHCPVLDAVRRAVPVKAEIETGS